MISQKRFSSSVVDGALTRFLSDFIIPTEQHVRVYNYVHDPINGSDTEDILDPLGTGLFVRETDDPTSSDLIGLDKWDLVTNSILFYTAPPTTSSLVLEVATNPEEFGGTLVQPSIERAEAAAVASAASAVESADSAALAAADLVLTNADVVLTHADVVLTGLDLAATNADVVSTNADVVLTGLDVVATNADVVLTGLDVTATNADVVLTGLDVVATNADVVLTGLDVDATNADVVLTNADVVTVQLAVWNAQAWELTAQSYATEAEDTFVNTVTSDGDGTFTYTPTTDYSALHWQAKATSIVATIDEPTIIRDTEWATATTGGIMKAKLVGSDLFITIDGTDA
jgi:hypothetical protein